MFAIISNILDISWVFSSSTLGPLLILALGLIIYCYGIAPRRLFSQYDIPCPNLLPFIGHYYHLIKYGFHVFDEQCYTKCKMSVPKAYGTWVSGSPVVMLCDLDTIKKVLVKESASSFTNKFQMFEDRSSILRKNLLALRDDHWRHVRAATTPTFSSGKLRKMNPLLLASAKQLTENFENLIKEEKVISVKDIFLCYALDVTASTLFRLQVDSLKNPNHPCVKHLNNVFKIFSGKSWKMLLLVFIPKKFLNFLIWLNLYSIFPRDSSDFFEGIVSNAISERQQDENNEGQEADFLQLMMKSLVDENAIDSESDGYKWSTKGLLRDEILAQSLIFFFAGYDNLANTLTSVFYFLAVYPDVQEKLYKSVIEKIGDEEPTFDNVNKIEYLEMVLNETSRFHTLAVRLDRVCDETIEIDGIVIKKDWVIGVPVHAIHMDPDIWQDPKKFDPERFSAENREGMHACSFMPFGMGPRNCIGMRLALFEAKIAITHLVRRFRFTPSKETEIPLELNYLGRAKNPIKLSVELR